ncbi:NAD(P)H-dependent flavin oxidoreductase [Oceanisphaera avium]|uniref:Nitronate monooxygenase n=1 Tax=Oceanisphaera avium TaxID=1903694 RepID=A0A1Y0CWY6_9GAMM|nr:nitronate monooxygenase [Oceanisphaera avium]ART79407.1 nitronate monooxygenase [Oceanisphaera avium]
MPNSLLSMLNIEYPIIQAPMAGTATVALAAAVSNAGGLGSIGLGASTVEQASEHIRALKRATSKPFNVNVFCHAAPVQDVATEQGWLDALTPYFEEFSAEPPLRLFQAHPSFNDNPHLLALLLAERPAVVSFHFGLPSAEAITALKGAGIKLLGCATRVGEARAIMAAGLDGIIAQGIEAGGHRGVFKPEEDIELGLFGLLQLLTRQCSLPIIAAGGIMNGQGIAQVLKMGASGAQLGTAFILCPESDASQAYRSQLSSAKAFHTGITRCLSGRPARGLINRAHQELAKLAIPVAAYPQAYSVGKALHLAASQQGCFDFAPFWAGQGAPLARALPAAELMQQLITELEEKRR